MNIGPVLKTWRHREELTLKEASVRMGVSISTLQKVESGKPLDGKTLAAILRWMLV
jgi:transcriptional regulator with XRE-family HTH domain